MQVTPLLALDVWEHAYYHEHEEDREVSISMPILRPSTLTLHHNQPKTKKKKKTKKILLSALREDMVAGCKLGFCSQQFTASRNEQNMARRRCKGSMNNIASTVTNNKLFGLTIAPSLPSFLFLSLVWHAVSK